MRPVGFEPTYPALLGPRCLIELSSVPASASGRVRVSPGRMMWHDGRRDRSPHPLLRLAVTMAAAGDGNSGADTSRWAPMRSSVCCHACTHNMHEIHL